MDGLHANDTRNLPGGEARFRKKKYRGPFPNFAKIWAATNHRNPEATTK